MIVLVAGSGCSGRPGVEDGISPSGGDGIGDVDFDSSDDGPVFEEGEESGSGATETSGHAEEGSGTGEDDDPTPCGEAMVDLSVPAADVMLVLDKSRSMVSNSWDHDGDPETPVVTRWHTLVETVDWVTSEFNASINFGLQMFPSLDADSNGPGACHVAETPEVAIGPLARDQVLSVMPPKTVTNDELKIVGGTPAAEGYMNALAHVVDTPAAGARAIILVTDGAANCNKERPACVEDLNGSDCARELFDEYDHRLHDAVTEAFDDHDLPTYVIGIDIINEVVGAGLDGTPEVNPHEKLSELAEQGGVARTSGDKFYNTLNQDDLQDALGQIAGLLRSCVVNLTTNGNVPPEAAQVPFVSFEIGDETVPFLGPRTTECNGEDGWYWLETDPPNTTVELCGRWCDELKLVTKLDAEYGCEPPAR